jgi:hypothetical protein
MSNGKRPAGVGTSTGASDVHNGAGGAGSAASGGTSDDDFLSASEGEDMFEDAQSDGDHADDDADVTSGGGSGGSAPPPYQSPRPTGWRGEDVYDTFTARARALLLSGCKTIPELQVALVCPSSYHGFCQQPRGLVPRIHLVFEFLSLTGA